ncbi:MAG: hypothetical protein LC796_12895 [Acidobacteria bacterium]|nr:hypothetical protein [Acidobacteriota bacterium]MCA1611582.1 hypothetical protein [Acidobacteriota bacterium]
MTERAIAGGEAPPEASADRSLWFGIVAPPLAWAANELAGLLLPDWVCKSGHRWVLHAITAAALAIAVLAGAMASRSARPSEEDAGDPEGPIAKRRRFMSQLAVMSALFFSLVIVAGAVPGAIHRPCD